MSKMRSWDVYRNIDVHTDTVHITYDPGQYMTTVFFDADMSKADVKRALVEHDGFPSTIRLRTPATNMAPTTMFIEEDDGI